MRMRRFRVLAWSLVIGSFALMVPLACVSAPEAKPSVKGQAAGTVGNQKQSDTAVRVAAPVRNDVKSASEARASGKSSVDQSVNVGDAWTSRLLAAAVGVGALVSVALVGGLGYLVIFRPIRLGMERRAHAKATKMRFDKS